jgi:hypothetical protein
MMGSGMVVGLVAGMVGIVTPDYAMGPMPGQKR